MTDLRWILFRRGGGEGEAQRPGIALALGVAPRQEGGGRGREAPVSVGVPSRRGF